jgi:thiol-disulfide isomerase/thioredoxin
MTEKTSLVLDIAPTMAATDIAAIPSWFDIELEDAISGEMFSMSKYSGKVVLVETMAIWCPTCVVQAYEMQKMHRTLGKPEDLVLVSLDVDFNEDKEPLGKYAYSYGFDWHYAVAPIEVARALGNLYSAQYLNPPLSPMLIIDKKGIVLQLPYGKKDAQTLRSMIEPFLEQ